MTTVRHVARLWQSGTWGKLLRELLQNRPESSPRLETELHSLVACAAMAMIRLDELNQSHIPLFSKLLRTLLCSQDADGGWRDPLTTAVCLRAVLIDRGHGIAIDRAMSYLAIMQKNEGIWPKVPIRRTSSDGFTSAFILFHLGMNAQFRTAVRFDDAVRWFEQNEPSLEPEARRLWNYASAAARISPGSRAVAPLWS